MKKKLKDNKGFSLLEMIIVTFLIAAVASLMAVIMSDGVDYYNETILYSEAKTLSSTVNSVVADELRYAKNVRVKSSSDGVVLDDLGTVFFTGSFGADSRITSLNGKLVAIIPKVESNTSEAAVTTKKSYIEIEGRPWVGHDMLSYGQYSKYNIQITGMAITYDKEDKLFTVKYQLANREGEIINFGTTKSAITFNVKHLN